MAKLYPPIIEGTLPAFYSDTIENLENGGMVEITIPFSMNKAVSISEVKGFSLKIKTVSSNTYLLSLKLLESGNNITNVILNNCSGLFLSTNELKSAEIIKWQILQWLGSYCIDRSSLNNITQTIQSHYQNFLDLKLSREDIIFYNSCIDKNEREIAILNAEKNDLNNLGGKESEIAEIDIQIQRLSEEISNFYAEIETLNNNVSYLESLLFSLLNSSIISIEGIIKSNQVSFCISATNALIQDEVFYAGQHYKMQLAYIKTTGEVGYYSTVGIAKFTTKPTLYIADLDELAVNNYRVNFTGFYDQTEKDTTEKVYNYQFNLYYNGELYLTSGWLLHNSLNDDSTSSSCDIYSFEQSITPNLTYQLEYKVRTINNLEISTKLYNIVQQEALLPECSIEVKPILNFNNAYVDLYLTTNEEVANGAFLISRTDDTSNYSNWVTLTNLSLNNKVFSNEFIFRDYTIQHGITYIYAVQQYNSAGLFSRHIKAEKLFADFEDIFLYDGVKQLKIKYNPKVASFKNTLLENKTDTIGSKYPFFFKNPRVSYKEFSISGLISYHSDEEDLFINKEDIKLIEASVNLTGENIVSERLFKTAALEWLTNGKPKLFKSPSEGNFIVRLMNVSLSPIDTVNRMLHTFNCTAYEIADYNFNNCRDYNFIKVDSLEEKSKVYKTINLEHYNTSDFQNLPSINPDYDIYSIEFNTNPNVYVYINGSIYYTDAEGHLKLEFDDVVFKAGSVTLAPGINYGGTVTYSYYGAPEEGFSNIASIEIGEVTLRQITDTEDILSAIQDIKTEILAINYLKAYSIEDDRYYINIDGKILDFNGIDGIELTNIIEPTLIQVSSPNVIVECGYQYCNKIYKIELALNGSLKNKYEEYKEILSIANYKQMMQNYNELKQYNVTTLYRELERLQQSYLNGEITSEAEYRNLYEAIAERYSEQMQNEVEQRYINYQLQAARHSYLTNMIDYNNLVQEKLSEEAI